MRKLLLTALAFVLLTGCAASMSPVAEYTIDSSAYAALTTEKLVLGRPCTASVTDVCVDADLARTLKDSRLLLMTALLNYQVSRDAYLVNKAGGGTADEAAVASAHAALKQALLSANAVLALDVVKAILTKVGG